MLAVGCAYADGVEEDMEKLMNHAEKRMYEDKSEYYRTMGIERRRR